MNLPNELTLLGSMLRFGVSIQNGTSPDVAAVEARERMRLRRGLLDQADDLLNPLKHTAVHKRKAV